MKAVLFFAVALLSTTAYADQTAEEAIQDWRAANWTCESGQDHDGAKVGIQEVKEACVRMGVLTAQLSHAGYCYDDKTVEWATCK